MKTPRNAVIIGSGNLAEALARAIAASGLELRQLFARNEERARTIAALTGCPHASRPGELCTTAGIYLIAVSDAAVGEVARTLPIPTEAIVAHTAGSVPLEALPERFPHRAVFYPMQTFTRGRAVDFREIPIFVEAADADTQTAVEAFATQLSHTVLQADSARRARVHLAAVFACNFANRMYALGERIVQDAGLDFGILKPLIAETARKACDAASPADVQTGPAARHDTPTLARHEALLAGDPTLQELYKQISQNIWETSRKR